MVSIYIHNEDGRLAGRTDMVGRDALGSDPDGWVVWDIAHMCIITPMAPGSGTH